MARPDLRGRGTGDLTDEWDERVGDLQYRDLFEYAVGHGVAARVSLDAQSRCQEVCTEWLPSAQVEQVEAAPLAQVELGMEALACLADGADAAARLSPMVEQYRTWIAVARQKCAQLTGRRATTAGELLSAADDAAGRIAAGIDCLADPEVLTAFRFANRAMAAAARRREAQATGQGPESVSAPTWRPFQLAYLLVTLRGVADHAHPDRDVVDLLFFPTGGGKTEAYLGLTAFVLVLRRLRHPGLHSAGVSVLMRYQSQPAAQPRGPLREPRLRLLGRAPAPHHRRR